MKFLLVPPNKPREVFGDVWQIFGDGPIDLETAPRLSTLLKQNGIHARSTIYLNSPGGSLLGGMNLGRVIRAAAIFTSIGRAGAEAGIEGFRYRRVEPGGCYSAGAVAFLGGRYRWVDDKSQYGVHRFYADKDPGSDVAQTVSSQIIEYMKEMGVDAALFTEMAKAGGDEINLLSLDRLRALGVTNGLLDETIWTIESFGEGLYVKGERVTWRGINQFILVAEKDRNTLHAVFDPEGRGAEAIKLGAHSLIIDYEPYRITPNKSPYLRNGLVNCLYDLSPNLLRRIKSAKTIGVALRWTHQAPLFLGFHGMDIGEEGRTKLTGYLALFGR
ncbi:MAG: hypothetical protein K2X72_19280 [Reyranella sp.]|nr:hypothetical protein [Reyranella sp.]